MDDLAYSTIALAKRHLTPSSPPKNANPGLKSRFNKYLYFEVYKPKELLTIFEIISEEKHFKLTEKSQVVLLKNLTDFYVSRDKKFGNGRLVRNIFERTIERQANRLVKFSRVSREMMMTILPEDIP